MMKNNVPRVATLAINVKGADLLFLDHLDDTELEEHDHKMWKAADVDVKKQPFGRVIVYVPLANDGLNRNTLRTNQGADQAGYSETREFALGIQALWPYLYLFFDNRSTAASNLLAEVEKYFEETNRDQSFTLAEVLHLFGEEINKPQADRKEGRWAGFNLQTIRAVEQRFRALPATLGGLIDVTGTGFGLDELTDLKPYDMIVIDFERIMTNPRDPEVAENAIKIITAYIFKRLTEAMTRGTVPVDHVIVFADELNRLAPRRGDGGIGEYLAQIARTTRDRGVVLFGAGQYRSGVNEDILKSASVHYSMQTPDYELSDRIYSNLSPEFKARLTRLKPGETLLQYPSLRTAVFARFPRPFVMTGGISWREQLPEAEPRPMADCIAERLRRLDPQRPPQNDEVRQLIDGLPQRDGLSRDEHRKQVVQILRDVEMTHAVAAPSTAETPWGQFSRLVKEKMGQIDRTPKPGSFTPTPPEISDEEESWDE